MFPSNQRGKVTKEEKSSIVLYFSSIGVWFHKNSSCHHTVWQTNRRGIWIQYFQRYSL